MRAIVVENCSFQIGEQIEIRGETAFHLIRVVRIQVGEDILILDGRGKKGLGKIRDVKKRIVSLELLEVEEIAFKRQIDLAFGIPKKDAIESLLRSSVEVGYRKLLPLRSQFSQPQFHFSERWNRILVSSLEQSNNPLLPELQAMLPLASLPFDEYDHIFFYSSEGGPSLNAKNIRIKSEQKNLVIIGPEGGWSEEELQFIKQKKNVHTLSLDCPILRTPTASVLAMGQLLLMLD